MEATTIREINGRLDRIERLTLLAAKPVLDIQEAVLFTGFSLGHLYRLTSSKEIPHYKKDRKLYFKKSELEEWMLGTRVLTNDEIDAQATKHIITKKR